MKRLLFILSFVSTYSFAQTTGAITVDVVAYDFQRTQLFPVDSAMVKVFCNSNSDTLTGYTDSLGRCRIMNLPEGVYTLEVYRRRYSTYEQTGIIVSANKMTYLSGTNCIVLAGAAGRKGIKLVPVDDAPRSQ